MKYIYKETHIKKGSRSHFVEKELQTPLATRTESGHRPVGLIPSAS